MSRANNFKGVRLKKLPITLVWALHKTVSRCMQCAFSSLEFRSAKTGVSF
jgi:hypothetical protein